MSDYPVPILQQLEARFEKLRAKDSTVRKYQREMDAQTEKIRNAHALRKCAAKAKQERERWLHEEAAAQLRQELGIKTIEGFKSRREGAIAFRQRLKARHQEAVAATRRLLQPSPPPSAT